MLDTREAFRLDRQVVRSRRQQRNAVVTGTTGNSGPGETRVGVGGGNLGTDHGGTLSIKNGAFNLSGGLLCKGRKAN